MARFVSPSLHSFLFRIIGFLNLMRVAFGVPLAEQDALSRWRHPSASDFAEDALNGGFIACA
jgi:hypothetical protein